MNLTYLDWNDIPFAAAALSKVLKRAVVRVHAPKSTRMTFETLNKTDST